MKNVLLMVVGTSPAVITETLFAIQRDGLPWPDEIRVITTLVGEEKLKDMSADIAALVNDYPSPGRQPCHFRVDTIKGANGLHVKDAKSVEDHEALGNFIMEQVRDLTSDEAVTVHASIAGGRKTMTFYLGYAMSLFGRSGDRLSHVLVSEPFEQIPQFRYPTPSPVHMNLRGAMGASSVVDAADAEVILADIPFVRLREELPGVLLGIGKDISFRKMVELINIGERERTEHLVYVHLPSDKAEIRIVNKDGELLHSVELKPFDYAFYKAIVLAEEYDLGSVFPPLKTQDDTDLAVIIAEILLGLVGKVSKDQPLTELLAELEDAYEMLDPHFAISPKTLQVLKDGGVTRSMFTSRMNKIQQDLELMLPAKLARWLILRQVGTKAGNRLDFYGKKWPPTPRKGSYGIALHPNQIHTIG